MKAISQGFWRLVAIVLMLLVPALIVFSVATNGIPEAQEAEQCAPVAPSDMDC